MSEEVNPKIPGMIFKAASLSAQEVTKDELEEINKYTLVPLDVDEVFTFKAVLCDNEVDRDFERFTLKALQGAQKHFLGKTVIKDHAGKTDNQVARIYSTELVQKRRTTSEGEPYTQLVARCYMVRTLGNADLIREIQAGIKKEGSVRCSVSSIVCSICGTDNIKNHCRHYAGKTYDRKDGGGKQVCTFALASVTDAYEFSFTPIPAQRAAGVSKSYAGRTVYDDMPDDAQDGGSVPGLDVPADASLLALRARLMTARLKANKNMLMGVDTYDKKNA